MKNVCKVSTGGRVSLSDKGDIITIVELSTTSLTGLGLRLTDYLTRPCCCCGHDRHSMLNMGHNEEGTRYLTAGCPCISNFNAVPVSQGHILEYEFRAEVLARNHHYEFTDARQTVNQLLIHGSTMYQLPKKDRDRFKLWLREYCEMDQRNPMPKRRISPGKKEVPDELRRAPCRGCGSPFHGLLEYHSPSQTHRYKCPCHLMNEDESSKWYHEGKLPYQLCPRRLAKENGYDKGKVMVAMNRYEHRGAGKFKPPEANGMLRMRALEECDRSQRGYQPSLKERSRYLGGSCPAKVIGIEGWDRPVLKKGSGRKESDASSTTLGKAVEEKTTRETKRALVLISLGILIALLLYISVEITDLPIDTREQPRIQG